MSISSRFRCSYLLGLAGMVPSLLCAQPRGGFDELWAWEQGVRRAANTIGGDERATTAQLDSAVASLNRLLAWCQSPTARRTRASDGRPLLVWQQGDIYLDLLRLHGRRNDEVALAGTLRMLASYLGGPSSPIATGAADAGLYSLAAEQVTGNPVMARFAERPGVREMLDTLRRRDGGRHLRALPFSIDRTDSITVADRIAGLSYLWSEAKYNFVHFDHVPTLDWSALYRETVPKVIAATTTLEYYRVLQAFLARLEDGHTDVQLPSPLGIQHELRPRLLTELVEGRVFVRYIGHPSYAALGFAVGQEVTHVDGEPVIAYGKTRIEPYMAASTLQDRLDRTYGRSLLRGPMGQAARLTVVGRDGGTRTIAAPRDTALAWAAVPNVEFRMLADSVAYVAINTFNESTVPGEFAKLMPRIRTARGLIIDVRENGGGNSQNGWDVIAQLIDRPSATSSWSSPEYVPAFRSWGRAPATHTEKGLPIRPAAKRYAGPVAVLIGPRTFSAAEDFAVAFELSGRGPLIGEATGGSTGNPISLRLPGGGFARICSKRDTYPDGRAFVGVGVQPTLLVPRRVVDVQAGRDAVLERAIAEVQRAPKVRVAGRGL
jgi:carboxyl-terminal processing protease